MANTNRLEDSNKMAGKKMAVPSFTQGWLPFHLNKYGTETRNSASKSRCPDENTP